MRGMIHLTLIYYTRHLVIRISIRSLIIGVNNDDIDDCIDNIDRYLKLLR